MQKAFAVSLALTLFAGCASAGVARSGQAESRRATVTDVLKTSVRILVYSGTELRRTASGVIISSTPKGNASQSLVITNEHVVDTQDIPGARFTVAIDQGGRTTELPAKLMAEGTVPAQDLALLQIEGPKLMPAVLAGDDELAIGDQVLVVGAPFGNGLSISGGMLSQVRLARGEPEMLKTDAPVGYGASGGGMFSMETGHLVGIIEGYRTAEVQVPGNGSFSFDVPMPGETFAAPLAKVRRFLAEHQQSLGTAQVALRN